MTSLNNSLPHSPLNFEKWRSQIPDFRERIWHEHKKLEKQHLVEFIYGRDDTKDLAVAKYTRQCTSQFFHSDWDPWLGMARGAVYDVTDPNNGKLEALPFSKFFNYGETPSRMPTSPHIVGVYEKCDGSLGTGFYWRDKWFVASSGAPCSPQALFATEYLRNSSFHDYLDPTYTYMFEIIYPENRIVLDYGDKADLVLLGARQMHPSVSAPVTPTTARETIKGGEVTVARDYSKQFMHRPYAEVCAFVQAQPELWEGVVVWYHNREMFKVKSEQYCQLHRIKSDISFNNTFDAIRNDKYDELLLTCPEEFRHLVQQWYQEIAHVHMSICQMVGNIWLSPYVAEFCRSDMYNDRKSFALFIQKHVPRLFIKYMFTGYDNNSISPLIYNDYKVFSKLQQQYDTWLANLQ